MAGGHAEPSRIVVVGEALVDVIHGPGAAPRAVPGGAPVNVAVGIARLGSPVAWCGPLGNDTHAELLLRHLAEAEVDLDLAVTVDAPTSVAEVALDETGHPTYTFHLDGTTNRIAAISPEALGTPAAVVVVGGAIGFRDPELGTSMAALPGRVHAPVWLDPNVRPTAVGVRATYRELVSTMAAHATVVKCSTEDLAMLVEPGEDPLLLARDWARSGPALVVVTLGSEGMLALRPDEGTRGVREVRVPATPVEVVDTVGAGDTVTAALAHWALAHRAVDAIGLRGLDDAQLVEALAFALRAAAITCARQGADPPHAADLA